MKKTIIPKEELYQKYIVENISRNECALFFNVTERMIIRRLGEYGIKRDPKKTYLNMQKTILERYGVKHPSQSSALSQKARLIMKEKYGVEYTAQSDILRAKMQQTMLKRYGKKHYVETKSFQAKSSTTCKEKHGVDWPCQYPQCIKSLEEAIGHSKPEQEFADILDKKNIQYEREFPIRGFKYDFKIDNFLFEINPSGTHNVNFGLFGHEPKKKSYHYTKYSVAKEYNFHCVHIFDWDDKEKIIRLFLEKKERIFARDCIVKNVSVEEANRFLTDNHLQGYARDDIRIGLYKKNTCLLVAIITFAKPRYNKNFQYELVRLCTIKNVVGGVQKIFKHFVDQYCPKSIVSYCDLAKFDGNIYSGLGFKVMNKPKPSKHWVNLKTNQHITDNLLRQKGFDQLFKTNYGKGTSNEKLMLENDFVEVYDCGQLTFIWKT